jgi:hypothetical protein
MPLFQMWLSVVPFAGAALVAAVKGMAVKAADTRAVIAENNFKTVVGNIEEFKRTHPTEWASLLKPYMKAQSTDVQAAVRKVTH